MAGDPQMYDVVFTKRFTLSFDNLIDEWQRLGFSNKKVNSFVKSIESSIVNVRIYPFMHEDISSVYGFRKSTYRLIIGKHYAIYYRVNEARSMIEIGSIFTQKQLKLEF